MLIKNEKIIKKIFDRVYGIAWYGEYTENPERNMGIPYEIEANGKISEFNDKIYDIRRKIAEEYTGHKICDIDDYANLRYLDDLYTDMMKEISYKMFMYGFILNPENL